MRFVIGAILILIAGGVLAAAFLASPITLSLPEIKDLNHSCIVCHNDIPFYGSSAEVHNAHSTTECRVCHSEDAGLAAADNAHEILKWTGIGLLSLGLVGIISNFIVARIRINNQKGRGT